MRIKTLAIDAAAALGVGIASMLMLSSLQGGGKSARVEEFEKKTAHRSQEGSSADTPQHIPARGWWEIARRTYHEVERDRVRAVAAGVTFYALLALFPALTALVSIYGLISDPSTIAEHVAVVDGFMPSGAGDFLREQIGRIVQGGEAKLGFAFAISLSLAIWSANAGVKAIFDALNVAYGEDEKRGFIKLNAVSLAFTVGILAFVILAIAGVAAIPVLLDYLYLGSAAEWLIAVARWPILILLLIGSLLFSWYVTNFEDYNKTYGAIGAVIGLLSWMWLSATIVLVGAELNSEAERQTDQDTTTGAPLPMGLRGADAADQKG